MPSFDKNGFPRVHTRLASVQAVTEEGNSELTPDLFNDKEEMLLQEDPASYGNGYLEGLAHKLDKKAKAHKKYDSFGAMLHSFTSVHESKEINQALARSLKATKDEAQQKSDVVIPMPSFDKNGFPRVHTQLASLPTPAEEGNSELTPDLFDDEEEMLLQAPLPTLKSKSKGLRLMLAKAKLATGSAHAAGSAQILPQKKKGPTPWYQERYTSFKELREKTA